MYYIHNWLEVKLNENLTFYGKSRIMNKISTEVGNIFYNYVII